MAEGEGTPPPAEGEGQEAQEGGLYQEYLSKVPEDLRPHVEPILKDWDGNVTKKFQENAEYRKQWEPFEKMGVNNLDPQHLEQAMGVLELAQNEDQFNDFLLNEAAARGLIDPSQLDGQQEEPGQEGGFDPQQLQEMLSQALDERLGPMEQQFTQQQEQQQIQQIAQQIDQQFTQLEEAHGQPLGDDTKQLIAELAVGYAEDDPDTALQRAYDRWKGIVGDTEKGVFQSKLDQPQTPETGGQPATGENPTTSFEEAKLRARERMAQI